MKYTFLVILTSFAQLLQAQSKRPVDVHLGLQTTITVKDLTAINNPWSFGTFVYIKGNTNSKVQPVFEVTGDVFLASIKVASVTADGEVLNSLEGMLNLLGGVAFSPDKSIFATVTVGPSLGTGDVLFAVKPSLNFTASKGKLLFRISYLQLFNRGNTEMKGNYIGAVLGMGFRVFGRK